MGKTMAQSKRCLHRYYIRSVKHSNRPLKIATTTRSPSASSRRLMELQIKILINSTQSFMYTQILKEILLTIDFEQEHINEFLTYCREQFVGNTSRT